MSTKLTYLDKTPLLSNDHEGLDQHDDYSINSDRPRIGAQWKHENLIRANDPPRNPGSNSGGAGGADAGGKSISVLSRLANHLANERTILAWVRTALGTVALGVALVKVESEISGLLFIVVGLLTTIVGYQRYMVIKHALDHFPYEHHTSLGRLGVRYIMGSLILLFVMLLVLAVLRIVNIIPPYL